MYLAVSAKAAGRKVVLSISHARAGSRCVVLVAFRKREARFSVWRVGKSGIARIIWTAAKNAPSGTWTFSAICRVGKSVQNAKGHAKLTFKGSGKGVLVSSTGTAPSGGGKGGGDQSCAPIEAGGSGLQCFINDPFAAYGDIGQCTWYAAGVRPDLDGVEKHDASTWLSYAQKANIPTGSTPVVGAIAVNTTADGGVGHVAYVAGVENGGATLILDEANIHNNGGVFLNVTTPASEFQGYIYGGSAGSSGSSGNSAPSTVTVGPHGAVFDPHNSTLYFAVRGPNDTLEMYWDPVGQKIEGPLLGNAGGDVSAPSIAFDPHNDTLYIAVQGPNNTLEMYWNPVGQTMMGPLFGNAGGDVSAPSIAFDADNNTSYFAVQGPNNTLEMYWNPVGQTMVGPLTP